MPVQMKEGTDPYLKLMRDNFGIVGARLLDIAYIIALYGAGLSYQISFGFSMAEMPWNPSWKLLTDYRFWTVLYLFIEIPLCLLRSLRSISFASLGSVIVMILCCVVIIMYSSSSRFNVVTVRCTTGSLGIISFCMWIARLRLENASDCSHSA